MSLDGAPWAIGVVTLTVERRVEEWQVTGDPGPILRHGEHVGDFGPYQFVWCDDTLYDDFGGYGGASPAATLTAEQAARRFVAKKLQRNADGDVVSRWPVGPTLTRRTVVYTEWVPVVVDPDEAP